MPYIFKHLNVETWPLEYVLEWLKGISSHSQSYVKFFETELITGKKLTILEFSDLRRILSSHTDQKPITSNQETTIYKSIQSLLQLKHDLNRETLHSIIFSTRTRIVTNLNYIYRLDHCPCVNDCDRCMKYKRCEIVSASNALVQTYRRLISWLVRIPFTRLKPFENFRDEINNEMKQFLKLFRKRQVNNLYNEMKIRLKSMQECCEKMLDYCDRSCEKENGKIAVAYSCCYLEKVYLRRKTPDQVLGLKLTTLSDGVYTVAEIIRESAADECSDLNVEDDILAINSKIVIGWSIENILKLLDTAFQSNEMCLILRKMPKDHIKSIKQQKNLVFIYKNKNVPAVDKINDVSKTVDGDESRPRKHSFSEILNLSEEFIMEDSSDEDEEDYANFNRNKNEESSDFVDLVGKQAENHKKLGNLFEKNTSVSKNDAKSKYTSKINNGGKQKMTNKNRLIRSMQNLLSFDRSRSNSTENSVSTNDESEPKSSRRKKSIDDGLSKADLFRSLFSNKKWDLVNNSSASNKNSFDSLDSPSTPNLVGIKKIDSIKRANSKTSNNSNSSLNELGSKSGPSSESQPLATSITTNSTIQTVSRKPPIDKNKATYKMQSQKPTMQGWLYKKRNNSNTSNNKVDHLNRSSSWKKYWCVLTKDYITFYKNPDEKIPKDFFLLKDFDITKEVINSRKFCFCLVDRPKQSTHEFYTEQSDEFNDWFQVLSDLRAKMISCCSESLTSSSNTSLSSGYDTGCLSSDASTASSQPVSSTFNRRNNLQLQLSTIIDDDSLNNSLQKQNQQQQQQTSHKNSNQFMSPADNTSPTLIASLQQQYNNSSRESSPEYSNTNSKVASRDSSPGLNFTYQHEPETSESDADIYSLTLCPEKQDLHKEIVTKNVNKTSLQGKNLSYSSLNSVNVSARSGMTGPIKKQLSFSPSADSSGTRFIYEQPKNPQLISPQQRCNSLPNSLQSCVGSYLNSSSKKASQTNIISSREVPASFSDSTSGDAMTGSSTNTTTTSLPVYRVNEHEPTNHTGQQTTSIPVHLEFNNKESSKNETAAPTHNTNKNQSLQSLLLQFQKNSLLPKLIKRKTSCAMPIPKLVEQNLENSNDSPNSPSMNLTQLNNNSRQQPYNYYFQQHPQCSSPLTPQTPPTPLSGSRGKSTQISVQLGLVGLQNKMSQFNQFNFMTPEQLQFEPSSILIANNLDKLRKLTANQSTSSSINNQSPPTSVLYRTEITITPSTFKKPKLNNPSSSFEMVSDKRFNNSQN